MLREVIGRRSRRLALLAVALLTSMAILVPGNAGAQRRFDSAEAAMKAMIAEIEVDDQQAIVEILGAEYKDRLVTSDWDAERLVREKIAVAAKEKLEAKSIADDRVEWILGSALMDAVRVEHARGQHLQSLRFAEMAAAVTAPGSSSAPSHS